MEPLDKKTRLIFALVTASALVFSSLFGLCPEALGFSQTAAALGYEDYFDSSALLRVDIRTEADAWQSMLDNAMNETYIECDVALNGERIASAGIRCKGNSSLSMTQEERYSFKINFGEYVKKQTFHGLDKMVLNNTQSDNTFLKEYLSYTLLKRAGVKTPLFAMAEIYVNGEYWGLYLALECLNDSFIERNFLTDGGFLYKPDGTNGMGGNKDHFDRADNADSAFPQMPNGNSADSAFPQIPNADGADKSFPTMPDMGGSTTSAASLDYLGDDTALYADIFDYAKTNMPSDADKARLITSLKALSEGDLDASLNVSDAVAWLAANAVLVNDDGYLGSMLHNYYLYELNGMLTILPWDYNLAFGGFAGGSATSAVNDPIDTPASAERPLVTALLSDEDSLNAYHALLSELARFLSDGSMDQLITDMAALIDESVQNDPTKECTYEDYLTALSALRSFSTLRGQSILGQLDGSIPSTTEGQSADSSALIQAVFNLSDMGFQGDRGGFGEEMRSHFEPNGFQANPTNQKTRNDEQQSPGDTPPQLPDGETAVDQQITRTDEVFGNRRQGRPSMDNPLVDASAAPTATGLGYAVVLDASAALALIIALILLVRRRR